MGTMNADRDFGPGRQANRIREDDLPVGSASEPRVVTPPRWWPPDPVFAAPGRFGATDGAGPPYPLAPDFARETTPGEGIRGRAHESARTRPVRDDTEPAFEIGEDRPWRRLLLAAGLLMAGVAVAAYLLAGIDGPAGSAAPGTLSAQETAHPTAPPSPPPQESAQLVEPEDLAAYRPRQVTRQTVAGGLRVSWQPPSRADEVAGYLVVAQTPRGDYLATELPPPGERAVVFSGPPTAEDSCVIVVTLISGTPAMTLAPGTPVCAARSTPATASPAPVTGSGRPGDGTGS